MFQYFINKAHYWEKKFTLQENVKANKKLKNQNVDEQIAEFLGPPPTIYDTLPFQTYRGIKYLIFTIPTMPGTILSAYKEMKEKKAEEERLIREEEELAKQREIEKLEKKQRKRERKRIVYDEKEKGKFKNEIYLTFFYAKIQFGHFSVRSSTKIDLPDLHFVRCIFKPHFCKKIRGQNPHSHSPLPFCK